MNKLLFPVILMLLASVLLFPSCKKDADKPNEEELITTLTMTWTPVGGGSPVVFSFRDVDGDGGDAPVINTAPLAAGTEYDVDITLLDETKTPAENITEEVEEEGAEHQFFFQVTGGLGLSFSYQDADANGAPVGLKTRMIAGTAATGTLRVILRHDLNKGGAGVPQGDITNAGGETDIEVDFPVVIQ